MRDKVMVNWMILFFLYECPKGNARVYFSCWLSLSIVHIFHLQLKVAEYLVAQIVFINL